MLMVGGLERTYLVRLVRENKTCFKWNEYHSFSWSRFKADESIHMPTSGLHIPFEALGPKKM